MTVHIKLTFCTLGEGEARKADVNYNKVLSQAKGKIDKDWQLLNNQSTVNVVCNPALLRVGPAGCEHFRDISYVGLP
jgi:hypothetical protein